MKTHIWLIYRLYVCMMTQYCFTQLHLCLKTLWEQNSFSTFSFTFSWTDSFYNYIFQNLFSTWTSFQPYIICHTLFQFIFWCKTGLETVWRGLLTLKSTYRNIPIDLRNYAVTGLWRYINGKLCNMVDRKLLNFCF